MEKKTIEFFCKVKGNFSPNGLQKIFISYHVKDIEAFNLIVQDLFSMVNCAIYVNKIRYKFVIGK